jgi:hypothetical protein
MYDNTVIFSYVSRPRSDSITHIVKKKKKEERIVLFGRGIERDNKQKNRKKQR